MKITYDNTKSVGMPKLRRGTIKLWIVSLLAAYGKRLTSVNYLFMNDEELLKLNRQYLDHDYYTDILTFDGRDESSDPEEIIGDIAISLDRVRDNARTERVLYSEELHRVMAHGLLHLCGINDETDEEALEMRAAEEYALEILRELLKGKPYFCR